MGDLYTVAQCEAILIYSARIHWDLLRQLAKVIKNYPWPGDHNPVCGNE